MVWNFGELAPEAQATNRTAFLLQGNSAPERAVDTDNRWKCVRNDAYQPLHYPRADARLLRGRSGRSDGRKSVSVGLAAGGLRCCGMERRADRFPWNGAPRDVIDAPNRWLLVPGTIPPVEEWPERLASVRESTGVTVPSGLEDRE